MRASMVRSASLLAMSACLMLGSSQLFAGDKQAPILAWERVVGITPVAGMTGQLIEGIKPVGFPWTVDRGWAHVNLKSRRFQFFVQGLAIGAMPTPLSPIGTTGVVTWVKGTIVCTGGGPIIDTEPVELSPMGDAFLNGKLSEDLNYCDPGDIVFLLRVAAVLSGAPNITDSWLAYGAGRHIGNLDP